MTGRTAQGFDAALEGRSARLLRSDGRTDALPVARWLAPADAGDRWLLDRCTGPVLDVGCGPGRLVAALLDRGVPALGVDVSPAAQRLCRLRGVPMVLGDVFEPLPPTWRGRPWAQVLLADGNIGIGGDPARLLARVRELLDPAGSVLVETDPDPAVCWWGTVRVPEVDGPGLALPWACVGSAALRDLAGPAGWSVAEERAGARPCVRLRPVPRARRRGAG